MGTKAKRTDVLEEKLSKALAELKALKVAVREVGLDINWYLTGQANGEMTKEEALEKIWDANGWLDRLTRDVADL